MGLEMIINMVKNIFVWGVKQHISIGEFSAGEEYIMRGGGLNDWMTDDILVLKALRRKYESLWRKTRLTVYFDMYSESSMAVKKAISKSKSVILQNKISDGNGDQKKLFKIVDTLLGRNKEATLPKYNSPLTMASVMHTFFNDKIDNIRAEFPLLEANLPSYPFF